MQQELETNHEIEPRSHGLFAFSGADNVPGTEFELVVFQTTTTTLFFSLKNLIKISFKTDSDAHVLLFLRSALSSM